VAYLIVLNQNNLNPYCNYYFSGYFKAGLRLDSDEPYSITEPFYVDVKIENYECLPIDCDGNI